MNTRRLDKVIADSGGHSRKDAKALIRQGRVLLNGRPARSPEEKVSAGDAVTVDGQPIHTEAFSYIMLNKPPGVLCATRDPAQPTVLDLLPEPLRRSGLFPAGRLDKDTEGFVLLTNDGPFAHRLLSPRSHVPKTYHARLNASLDMKAAEAEFAKGMLLDGGDRCLPAEIFLLEGGPSPLVKVVLHEGKYHQIKRMFEQISRQVIWLKRVQIGGLPLDPDLALGDAREMLHKEVERIC